MRVVVKDPGTPPEVRIFVCGEVRLSDLQGIVGGSIEPVPLRSMPRGTTLMCNEEGKLVELEANIMIPGDVVLGTVVAVGDGPGGEVRSLTEDEAALIIKLLNVRSVP